MTPAEAGMVFVTPAAAADGDLFHRACALLRKEDPVHLVEHDDYRPFWAITKHADVNEIEVHPREFQNAPQPLLMDHEIEGLVQQVGMRMLIHMDDPDHKAYRAVTADWFKRSGSARLKDRVAQLARQSVDQMAERGGFCDFAIDIAMPYPLQVILSILGLPDSDYPRMLQLTQELFGYDDPEQRRGFSSGEVLGTVNDLIAYFAELSADRQAHPTGDLASEIANGTVHGEPLPPVEMISYYMIIATAGHDTTAATLAGGLQALIERPDQLERLQNEPDLIASATDEMIRWVTPISNFMRNVASPYQLRGRKFEPGDRVLLSYVSANRDEDVFDDPFRFDVGRSPNPHLAFGVGAHYCMAAVLAKMEIRALLDELIPRIQSIELAAEPEVKHGVFIGGLKHLPIRYKLN